MGQKNRSPLFEMKIRHGNLDVLDRKACQGTDPIFGQMKGEKGRYRGIQPVSQRAEWVRTLSASSGGPQQALAFHGGPMRSLQMETPVRFRSYGLYFRLGDDVDPGLPGGLGQAFDDGLRGVGHGKHSAIRLGFELHPAGGKPGDGLLWSETGQRSDEGFPPRGYRRESSRGS